jgi:tetratricopeptide (TPR) repeat protein
MFEILEGRLPFRAAADTSVEELQAALNSHEQPPEFATSNGSPGLRTIVSACLCPGPAGSYPTAVELLADIDREIANQPLQRARESFFKGQLPKTLRRYPRAFSGGFITAAALMVIGLLGFWLVSARQEQRVAWRVRQRLEASARVEKLLATSEKVSASLFYARMENSSVAPTSDQLLRSILQTIDCQPGDLFHEKWREVESLVSEAERTEARSCIIFLTLIAADARVRETRARQRGDTVEDVTPESGPMGGLQIRSILSVLPESLQSSRLADCLLTPSSVSSDEASSLLLAMGDVPVSTSIGALDNLLAAVRLANDGHDEESLRLLEKTSPTASLATIYWMLRGQLQHRLGNFREATAAFSIILNEQPDFEPALLCRGISLLARGLKDEAEVDFSRAIRNNPALADAFIHRCFVRQAANKLDKALEDVGKAIELRPTPIAAF